MTHMQCNLRGSTRSLTASAGAVYARLWRGVNQGAPGVAVTVGKVLGSLGVGLGITGCATLPRSTHAPEHRSGPYLLTAACDVEPLFVGQSHDVAIDTISRDFQDIARLGFDSVMLRHVDPREQLKLLDAARKSGLRVAWPDRGIQHYARTGSVARGVEDPRDLLRRIPRDIIAHPALASFVVEVGESPRGVSRGETVCDALDERGLPCVVAGQSVT